MVKLPEIIQGGMGVGVSGWQLANAVSRCGQLGVVSGALLETLLVRRLQQGDPGGHVRRALAAFPHQPLAERVLAGFFVEGGIAPDQPFRLLPRPGLTSPRATVEAAMAAGFVEVYLAREGHGGAVGINCLHKVAFLHLPTLYGAMLAGVDVVIMGAGIPRDIPPVLQGLCTHSVVSLQVPVHGASGPTTLSFDPREHLPLALPELRRPAFLPVISATALAMLLSRSGGVDGFIVEGHEAGGHNAPPRGKNAVDAAGDPVYTAQDAVDLAAMRKLGLPFWLAGDYGSAAGLERARELGAAGIQVGTAFAFCDESGFTPQVRARVRKLVREGAARVRTRAQVSPTLFPFKVLDLPGTLSDADVLAGRTPVCDIGHLCEPYVDEHGAIGYRCPAAGRDAYCRKGGAAELTAGKVCLCNALLADIGFGQRRPYGEEQILITAGTGIEEIARHFRNADGNYSAKDVIASILGQAPHITTIQEPRLTLSEVGISA